MGTNWEIVSLIGKMAEHAHRVFEEPALLDVSSPVAIFNQGWGSFTNRCLMTLLRATANTRKMTTSVAMKWRAGGRGAESYENYDLLGLDHELSRCHLALQRPVCILVKFGVFLPLGGITDFLK